MIIHYPYRMGIRSKGGKYWWGLRDKERPGHADTTGHSEAFRDYSEVNESQRRTLSKGVMCGSSPVAEGEAQGEGRAGTSRGLGRPSDPGLHRIRSDA